jgi:hypothetical protein
MGMNVFLLLMGVIGGNYWGPLKASPFFLLLSHNLPECPRFISPFDGLAIKLPAHFQQSVGQDIGGEGEGWQEGQEEQG